MKIELLYVPGCPNHPPALARIHAVMASQGISTDVEEIAINDEGTARALHFPGSPTIRVNGRDVEETPPPTLGTLACRVYRDPLSDCWEGVPSLKLLEKALGTKA